MPAELSFTQLTIAIGGGVLAGAINTLAGNGSAITLPILMFVLGLPPNVANGTNRIGILTQGLLGTGTFYRNKLLAPGRHPLYILPVLAGAILGVWMAVQVSPTGFKRVFGFLLILMLGLVLAHPKRWLRPVKIRIPQTLYMGILFMLGIYGGFIQMGMGIFFLATTVLVGGMDIIRANALKIFVVTLYTSFVLLIFHYKGLVDWRIGSIVAVGQGIGGWITAHWASKYPKADVWAYRLLLLTLVWGIVRVFWH